MEERFHSLATKIFKKDLLEITKEEAESLSSQYPYFAPLQFIKLTQSAPGTDAYQQQYQKSILYYPDPLTFDHFLRNVQEFEFERDDGGSNFKDDQNFEAVDLAQDHALPEELHAVPEEVPASMEDESINVINPEPQEGPLFEEELPAGSSHEIFEGAPEVKEEVADQGIVNDHEPSLPSISIVQPELTGAELTFEPYHTVDYFASQGIKVTADTVSHDKFGKQVKSFTDWLKTMKRLPLAELGKNVSPVTEKKVENLAEHSVQDADVVTESMAQVWEKQGNITKATEVYHKLSLQNPSKRAYFAAKIDKLTEEN